MHNHSKLSDYSKTAYLPKSEFRILSQIYNIARDGIQFIYYKKCFDSIIDKFPDRLIPNRAWYTYTINGYYDSAIHNWCMIFGTNSEPTHYKNLLKYDNIAEKLNAILGNNISENDILNHFIENSTTTREDYTKYHQETLNYRNKFLTHREHHPTAIKDGDLSFPILKTADEFFKSIYILLGRVAEQYNSASPSTNTNSFKYYNLKDTKQLESVMNNTFLPLDIRINLPPK